jgi:hypothetical protein
MKKMEEEETKKAYEERKKGLLLQRGASQTEYFAPSINNTDRKDSEKKD